MPPHRLVAALLTSSLLLCAAAARPDTARRPPARDLRYVADMQRVDRLWRQDRPDVPAIVRILLAERGYPRRSFEYGYWWHMCHRELRLLDVSDGPIVSLAWSADGRRLTARDEDGVVTTWSPDTGRLLDTTYDQAEANRLLPSDVPLSLLSPDGATRVEVDAGGACSIWDAASDEKRFDVVGHLGRVTCAAFAADGARVATGSEDGTVRVWDATTDRTTTDLSLAKPPGWPQDFSPDDKRLLIDGALPDGFRVCDSTIGKVLAAVTIDNGKVRFSPNGRWIATSFGDTATIWNAATGARVSEQQGFRTGGLGGTVFSFLSFTRDGRRLITTSSSGNVSVWDVGTTGQLSSRSQAQLDGMVDALDERGERAIGSGGTEGECLWELPSGRKLWQSSVRIQSWAAAFSPDGRWVAVGSLDGPVTVFDARTGRIAATLNGHTDFVLTVRWTRDSRRVISIALGDGTRIWDPCSGECLMGAPLSATPAGPAVSHDGSRLAFITRGRGVVILQAASDAEIRRWAALDRDLLRRMAAR